MLVVAETPAAIVTVAVSRGHAGESATTSGAVEQVEDRRDAVGRQEACIGRE
jgi:hypothetical protein